MTCLLIGSPGVGKTLLLKRLNACSGRSNYSSDVGETPITIPTAGTNLVNVVTSRRGEVTIRELGGCMAPIWKNYYKDCGAILYMVDLSNRVQVSASCIQLLDMLTHKQLHSATVLIVLNKIDIPGSMTRGELESVMMLNNIIGNAVQAIQVVEISAKDGRGLLDVARWLQEHGT